MFPVELHNDSLETQGAFWKRKRKGKGVKALAPSRVPLHLLFRLLGPIFWFASIGKGILKFKMAGGLDPHRGGARWEARMMAPVGPARGRQVRLPGRARSPALCLPVPVRSAPPWWSPRGRIAGAAGWHPPPGKSEILPI